MLDGTHVRLRLVEESDLDQIVTWRNAPRAWANFFNRYPLSVGGQRKWFAALMDDQSRKFFIICLMQGGEAIGTIGLDHIDFVNQRAEVGNVLVGDDRAVGHGHAKEAVSLLVAFAFDQLNMNRLYLNVLTDNDRAIGLYSRCGFREEGIQRQAVFARGRFRDVLTMSLLREDFRTTPAR